ncbi:MAG: lipoprotein signal peptidase [Crocinitomicaceae bacterium]|nr:lipoprotein signal peptidase [Crocinitomicaceae bacterium]
MVLVLDQGSKIWVKTSMYIGQEFQMAGNWFFIHFTENNGMAFGMEFAGENGKLYLTLFRIAASIAMLIYLIKIVRDKEHSGLIVSFALIFAGALGNIIDSVFYGVIFEHSHHQIAELLPEAGGYSKLFYGKVVDMLYFPIYSNQFPEWLPLVGGDPFLFFRPVFNVADTAISTGVISIVVFQKKFFPK